MSKNTEKIIKTLAKYGRTPQEVDYRPLGVSLEMCGPEGGWMVITEQGDEFLEYNIHRLINAIETQLGNHTDQKTIQKYCNHVLSWTDPEDHSKGYICAFPKCRKTFEENYIL